MIVSITAASSTLKLCVCLPAARPRVAEDALRLCRQRWAALRPRALAHQLRAPLSASRSLVPARAPLIDPCPPLQLGAPRAHLARPSRPHPRPMPRRLSSPHTRRRHDILGARGGGGNVEYPQLFQPRGAALCDVRGDTVLAIPLPFAAMRPPAPAVLPTSPAAGASVRLPWAAMEALPSSPRACARLSRRRGALTARLSVAAHRPRPGHAPV